VTRYRLYGITLATDHAFTWPVPRTAADDRGVDVTFVVQDRPPLDVDLDTDDVVHGEPVLDDEDRPAITFHVTEDLAVVRIVGVADHYLFADRIVCHLHDASHTYLVEIQLLGMVLALWLERRGVPTLHASVATVDDVAVAFLGVQGGGKTSAATSLVAAGHPLLVDDLLALEIGDEVLAHPGYPMLRLWPEQVDHFVGTGRDLPLVHPAYTKRKVTIGDGFGRFRAGPAPLGRIYLPRRTRAPGAEVTTEPLGSADAVIAMVRDSFIGGPMHGLGLAGPRLRRFARVIAGTEVATIRYPDGFDRLPELVAAVEADVRRG
jgi:hypothetical protein